MWTCIWGSSYYLNYRIKQIAVQRGDKYTNTFKEDVIHVSKTNLYSQFGFTKYSHSKTIMMFDTVKHCMPTSSEPSFLITEGGRVRTNIPEKHVENISEIADERGISRSQLLRHWIYAGWKAERSIDLNVNSDQSARPVESDPYEQIFTAALPEDEENAVDLNELKEDILSEVEGEIMRLYREYDGLSISNGRVYRDE